MRNRLITLFKSEFFRNVATLMTGTTIAQLIALAIYPVLTAIYTPEEHGLFSLYLSIITITGIVSTGRYQMAILMPREDSRAMNLVALGAAIGLAVSMVLLLMVILFRHDIGRLFRNEGIVQWTWFIPLSTFLIALFQVSIYWFNRNRNFRQTASANLAQSVSNSGVKLTTSTHLHSGGGLIAGAITGHIVGFGWALIHWIRRYRDSFRQISWREMGSVAREYYRFPGFNLPNNLVSNISNSLPIFLLSSFFNASEVGLYGLGFAMIFRPMNLITNSMEQVFSQRIIKKFNENLPLLPEIGLLIRRSIQFGIVPFLLAGLFGPVIFRVIFGAEWEEAGRYMQLLVPWLFTSFLANQLTFLPDLFSRQKTAFLLNIIKLALRIGGMAIGIYYRNIYLTLGLFSAASLVVVVFTLFWYVHLARNYEKARENSQSRPF